MLKDTILLFSFCAIIIIIGTILQHNKKLDEKFDKLIDKCGWQIGVIILGMIIYLISKG